jgi:hypothetical protein
MKIETRGILRALTPSLGMWLYNENHKVISDKVYLGKEADEAEWVEITSEEKARLEALWNDEIENSDEATKEYYQKAQAYDIITGGAE